MAYDAKTERLIALKKLAGKAQTSNDKGLANEALPSGLTLSSETVFGQEISKSPASANLYDVTGQVEYLRFQCSFIAGSDTSDGRHGFELKLPSDYQSNSSNPSAGTYPYINDQAINITSGSLQLVPPSFATSYEGKPFYGGSSTKDTGTQIPVLDARDWYLDYFNGIFFQQDPPGTGDHSNNPDFLEGYLYIGKYLDTVVSEGSSGGGNGDKSPQYLVLAATASLPNERVFTAGTGIKTTDSGAGAAYTVAVRDSIVATLTGSIFSGTVSAPALSGSLTKLQDGTSYIKEGSNVTVTTASNGSITIASTNTTYTAGDGLDLSGTEFSVDLKSSGGLKIDSTELAIDNSVVATLTGSTFSGTVSAPALSGSLTKLQDGTSYLIAGSNTTIATGSSGAITISSTGGIDGSGAANRIATWSDSDTLTSDADFTWNGSLLDVQGDVNLNGTVVVNQSGVDKNFRVETQNKSSALQVDGETDQVLLFSGSLSDASGHGSSAADPDPRAFTDTNFFVSGSIDSRGTSRRGTSVFGGDVLSSGSIIAKTGISGSLTKLSDGTSYLRAGSNVTITSGSGGSITIASSGGGGGSGETRTKQSYFLAANYAPNTSVPVSSSDFSDASYDPDKIDIFVNGMLVHSGTVGQIETGQRDYYVSSATSLKYSFGLKIGDVIDVVVFSVS